MSNSDIDEYLYDEDSSHHYFIIFREGSVAKKLTCYSLTEFLRKKLRKNIQTNRFHCHNGST